MIEIKYRGNMWVNYGIVERSIEFMVKKFEFNFFLLKDNF